MKHAELPQGLLDIHSHILPGLDDGPTTFDQCLETAKRYLAIGVDTVIATPHSIQGSRWNPAPARVRELTGEVERKLAGAGVTLRLLPGMEIAVSDLACGRADLKQLLPLADTGVYLVEFPLDALELPGTMIMEQCVVAAGHKRIIIAHPERCAMFHDNIDMLAKLVAAGAMLQVNTGSLLKAYGNKIHQFALKLFEADLVHFLATDTHGRSERMVPTPKQLAYLNRILGREAVTTGFQLNPRRLLAGETALQGAQSSRAEHRMDPTGGLLRRIRRFVSCN